MIESSKTLKFDAVAKSLFELLGSGALTRVTHSNIAKKSNVSRAWLYKYIGKERDDLISFAIDHLGKQIIERDRLDVVTNADELKRNIVTGVERMFGNTVAFPWLIPVYYKYRGTPTKPGESIREIEQSYVRKQAKHFTKFAGYSETKANLAAEILTSFRMGIAFGWQSGDIRNRGDSGEVLDILRDWLAGV
jgi:hypothetical protein